ncbi:MAG: hypothetical protein AAFX93_15040 [Verrucomicrobiota bacterium]
MPLDQDSWFLRIGKRIAIVFAVLLTVGLITSPLQNHVWGDVRTFQPELNLEEVEEALGQGIVIGLFGGFRTLMADMVYLRANHYWERQDRANTEALIALTTSIDPRPMFFWQNGARMLAYDIPVWRIRERGEWEDVPQAYRDQVFKEQAERGLAMMDRAEKFFPGDYRVPLEKAQIYLNKLEDLEKAAEYYDIVAQYDNAPFYAARIHAEVLKRMGRYQEALDYLKALYPTLPPTEVNPQASREVVMERIRELEDQINVPPILRYPQQPYESSEDAFGQSSDFSNPLYQE